jgi:signal transduction histidine kinase
VGAVVRRVASRLHRIGADRGVEVELRASEPETDIRMSEGHLEQVLVNLLLNAFAAARMSDKDPRVVVEIAWRGPNLHLSVRDNGPGVHPQMERRLFEPYASGDAERVGLGLAVSRQLARSMGADLVFARPAVGSGAEFRVVFERPRETARELSPVSEISEVYELAEQRAGSDSTSASDFDDTGDTIADKAPVQAWAEETARLQKKE